jgi:hypothetical protein
MPANPRGLQRGAVMRIYRPMVYIPTHGVVRV